MDTSRQPPATSGTKDPITPEVHQPDPGLRRNPSDMDIQEGQERIQADLDPRPTPPPGKLNDHIKE